MGVTLRTYDGPPSPTPEDDIDPLNMAISNELSSEIAAAILTEKKTPQELHHLKEILLRVHSTLQDMANEARAAPEATPPKAESRMNQ